MKMFEKYVQGVEGATLLSPKVQLHHHLCMYDATSSLSIHTPLAPTPALTKGAVNVFFLRVCTSVRTGGPVVEVCIAEQAHMPTNGARVESSVRCCSNDPVLSIPRLPPLSPP